jgi:aminopeptidase S
MARARNRSVHTGLVAAVAVLVTLGLVVLTNPFGATETAPAARGAPHIEVGSILPHLATLQSIADANGGNRAAGTPGYAKSATYVANTLDAAGFTVTEQTCTTCTEPHDVNVVADWPDGDENATIMMGAHLDSVAEGPGSNDNGSGTAALLQIALTLANARPELAKHVRFAWFADEEQEDDGSTFYVEHTGVRGVEAYINLDMIASPNPGYFLSSPDTTYAKAIAGYLERRGILADEWPSDCDCSDDAAFTDAGVATTYLNTGDEDEMTAEQAARWHGTEGTSFDECYHSACDRYPDNIDTAALEITSNAANHALWQLAVAPA